MTRTRSILTEVKTVLITGGAVAILALLEINAPCSTPVSLEKEVTPAGEFWVSTNMASRNVGTLDDPFVCLKETQFDQVMSNLPPDCTLHILAGTYLTHGSPAGYSIKTGQKVIGGGIDVTVLKLATNTPDNIAVMGSYPGMDMEVSDLTCDGNYQGQNGAAVTYHGVILVGTHNAIRRVKVIHLAKYGGNSEAWGFVLGPNPVGNSTGNIIENCEVTDFQGGLPGEGISAFSLNGTPKHPISGIVQNNRVLLQPDVYHPVIAFNNNDVRDGLYQGNDVDGATFGFYGDTGYSLNVSVVLNTFRNVIEGVSLSNAGRLNMTFSENKILLATNKVSIGIAFNIQETWVTNISIIGNVVSWNTPPPPGTLGCFLNISDISGLRVTDNKVEGTLTNLFWSDIVATNYVSANNHDLNGQPYLIPLPTQPRIDKSTQSQ
jgi:hypothetical protein